MTAFNVSLTVLLCAVAVSFFYGLITRNYSTVDRLWSVLPSLYMLIWMPDFAGNPRYMVLFFLVLLWGTRLTVNFALKGGYRFSSKEGFTGEDYRWAVLRSRMPNRFLFELFNLFFISAFQLILIFMFTLPAYYYGSIEGPVSTAEIILYLVHLLLLTGETVSDVQQLRYHSRKKKTPWREQYRYMIGFNTFGLWRFSRHPNYFCEIGQWVTVALCLAAASGGLHYSFTGAAALIILFIGSTIFAESITSSKYPEYREWKRLTSVWLPLKTFFRIKERTGFLSRAGSEKSMEYR